MHWWHWVLIALAIYLGLGIGMSVLLSQTPYADNGWIVTTMLWPLFLLGIMGVIG